MSVISQVFCRLNRHSPVRRDVVWDGRNYIGLCRECGAPIARIGRNKWHRRETDEAAPGDIADR